MKVLTGSPLIQRSELSLTKTLTEGEKTMEIAGKPNIDNLIEWTKKNPKEATSLIKGWIEER
jgi:hypothetical protein